MAHNDDDEAHLRDHNKFVYGKSERQVGNGCHVPLPPLFPSGSVLHPCQMCPAPPSISAVSPHTVTADPVHAHLRLVKYEPSEPGYLAGNTRVIRNL